MQGCKESTVGSIAIPITKYSIMYLVWRQWTARRVYCTALYQSYYDTPPCEDDLAYRGTRYRSQLGTRNIHNYVPQMKEANWLERLREEISNIIRSRNVGHDWHCFRATPGKVYVLALAGT